MKNLKYLKYVLSLSLLICVGYFYAMKRGYGEISSSSSSSSSSSFSSAAASQCVETYFVPRDQVWQQLVSFLRGAQNQILVAVYWLTYQPIINLLIAKKRQGKDVQVIIDESVYTTFDNIIPEEHMNQFLDENIDFFVYPSQAFKNAGTPIGLMHNKFVVIDGEHVFTGSANFTQVGLGAAEEHRNNYENVVVIHDRATAQKYIREFEAIKNNIHDLESSNEEFSEEESSEEFPLTQPQIDLLRRKGYSDQEIARIGERVSGWPTQAIFHHIGSLPYKRRPQPAYGN